MSPRQNIFSVLTVCGLACGSTHALAQDHHRETQPMEQTPPRTRPVGEPMQQTPPPARAESVEGRREIVPRSGSTAANTTAAATAEAPAWPAGWMVSPRDEYYPIVDDFGTKLGSAREAFRASRRADAARDVSEAVVILERHGEGMEAGGERDRLRAAIPALRRVQTRLEGEGRMTLREIDNAFISAYRADLRDRVSPDTFNDFEGRTDAAFSQAATTYRNGNAKDAAISVRQAAGYLRADVLSTRTPRARQSRITRSVGELERLADRLDRNQVRDAAELDRAFDDVRTTRSEVRASVTTRDTAAAPNAADTTAPRTQPVR